MYNFFPQTQKESVGSFLMKAYSALKKGIS